MKTLFQNLWVKAANEPLQLVQSKNKLSSLLFFLILLLVPTQLGLHFWPSFAYVSGQQVDYLSPTLYITDCLIAGLFLLQGFRFVTSLKLWVLSVVGFVVITIVFSSSPLAGWFGVLKLFEFGFFGWYIATHVRQAIQFLMSTFPIAIVIESILALWQFILQGSVGGLWYFLGERTFSASTPGIANASIHSSLVLRPYGTFPHPNVLAGFLLIGLVFLATFFRKATGIQKILIRGVLLLGSTALCVSLSRSAIVLGAVMVVFLLVHIIAFKTRIYKLQVLATSIVGFFILAFFLFPRFTGVNVTGESLVLRGELIQASWQMIVTRPLIGVGLNNFLSVLPLVAPRLPIQPVHNTFILVISETGIIGLSVFMYVLFISMRHIYRSSFESQLMKNYRTFTLLFFFIWLSIGLVDHYFLTLQQGQLLTAVLFGLTWARYKN